MYITIEMACSINGIIATKDGNEDFLSDRNYKIMLNFLKSYDCLVWGNTTFKNVVSWGENYIKDLKEIKIIVFSKKEIKSKYSNVEYCNSLKEFKKICKRDNLINIFVSGGANINSLFIKSNLVDNVIINYNPCIINEGINLFEGEYFKKDLKLNKIVKEKDDIIQIWYDIKK